MTGLLAAVPPIGPGVLVEHAAKTLIIVLVLIAGFRLLGKREMSQLNIYDLALLMAISNAVQNAMTGGLGNLTAGLVTSATVVVTAWALIRLLARRPGLERRVLGSPVLLVHDGRVFRDRMRRQRVTVAELDQAIREHGLQGSNDAGMVVLEVDGSLSVVPRQHLDRQPRQPGQSKQRGRRRLTPRGGRSR